MLKNLFCSFFKVKNLQRCTENNGRKVRDKNGGAVPAQQKHEGSNVRFEHFFAHEHHIINSHIHFNVVERFAIPQLSTPAFASCSVLLLQLTNPPPLSTISPHTPFPPSYLLQRFYHLVTGTLKTRIKSSLSSPGRLFAQPWTLPWKSTLPHRSDLSVVIQLYTFPPFKHQPPQLPLTFYPLPNPLQPLTCARPHLITPPWGVPLLNSVWAS